MSGTTFWQFFCSSCILEKFTVLDAGVASLPSRLAVAFGHRCPAVATSAPTVFWDFVAQCSHRFLGLLALRPRLLGVAFGHRARWPSATSSANSGVEIGDFWRFLAIFGLFRRFLEKVENFKNVRLGKTQLFHVLTFSSDHSNMEKNPVGSRKRRFWAIFGVFLAFFGDFWTKLKT